MRRSLQDLLAHADEIADKFEDYEPQPGDQDAPVSPLVELRLASLRRSAAERELANAVQHARAAAMSWRAVGEVIGTSGEAARQRYGSVV